ncbi:AAA family ATPase [Ceratobasidium sp. AG-Ba]|nr:AAA family ATPase [Ceratobasidium sp. AG-Ba]
MPEMDDDKKAIMEAIMSGSDNPVLALLANMVPQMAKTNNKRPRSDSTSLDDDGAGRFAPRICLADPSNDSKPGPSSSGSEEPKEESSSQKGDEVVERVKRSNLDSYERALTRCIVDPDQIATSFDSVCLPDDTIDLIRSMIELPLLCPEQFEFGILKRHSVSGALLFGPPGTGKTLCAQALAKESGARMISLRPSDILHKYVGESERLVKATFSLARKLQPCVVFIDELDALFGTRTRAGQESSARWHTSMLTEFMQEMDGLLASRVIVVGATNRPFDLDDAVLRRLPCRVMVDLPDKEGRMKILKVLLQEESRSDDLKLDPIAAQTNRYTGSDLKNLCLAAAFNAVKENVDLPWKSGAKVGKGKERVDPRPSRFEDVNESVATSTAGKSPSPNPGTDRISTGAKRVIAQRHFDRALKEIPPSSSDTQTSMTELRTWNTKFGSGRNNAPYNGGLGGNLGTRGSYSGAPGYTPGASSSGGPGYPTYGAPSYGREGLGMGSGLSMGSSSYGAHRYGADSGEALGGPSGTSSWNGTGASGTSGFSGLNVMSGVAGTSGMSGTSGIGGVGANSGSRGIGGSSLDSILAKGSWSDRAKSLLGNREDTSLGAKVTAVPEQQEPPKNGEGWSPKASNRALEPDVVEPVET